MIRPKWKKCQKWLGQCEKMSENGPGKIENFRKWMKKRENVKEFSWHFFICENVLTFMYFTNFLTIFEPFADIFTHKNSDILCITIFPSPFASGIKRTGWILRRLRLSTWKSWNLQIKKSASERLLLKWPWMAS